MTPGEFALTPGQPVRLAELSTTTTAGFDGEDEARASLEQVSKEIVRYQTYLMAHETYGLLVLFQGMDAAGKDEAIQHVLASLDPRGVEPEKFGRLSEDEQRQDYLRRASTALPLRGQVGIFNRSYYEQVVGDKVHPDRSPLGSLHARVRRRPRADDNDTRALACDSSLRSVGRASGRWPGLAREAQFLPPRLPYANGGGA